MESVEFKIFLSKIGKELKQLRKRKGYTSHETFAMDFDLPRAQYWRLESGTANFTIKTLYQLLRIHNIDVDEFFKSVDFVQCSKAAGNVADRNK